MFEVKKLQGERAVFDGGYCYFKLRHPYRNAGRRFGWDPPVAGLSLNGEILREAWRRGCKVRVFVAGDFSKCYEADPGKWLTYGRKHIVKGIALYCLPWQPVYFKTIRDFPEEIFKCFQEAM